MSRETIAAAATDHAERIARSMIDKYAKVSALGAVVKALGAPTLPA
jgi:hypothetical protein